MKRNTILLGLFTSNMRHKDKHRICFSDIVFTVANGHLIVHDNPVICLPSVSFNRLKKTENN